MPAWVGVRRRLSQWTGSIRLRLTLWSLVLLGAVLLGFSLFVYFRQARDAEVGSGTQLQDVSAQVSRYFKTNHASLLQTGLTGSLDELAQGQVKSFARTEVVLAVIDPLGKVSQRSKLLQASDTGILEADWQAVQANPKDLSYRQPITPIGTGSPRAYIFFFTPVPSPDLGVAAIVVGLPVDPGGQLANLAWTLFTGSLALLAADLLIGYWLAGRILRPVQAITRAAREIGETDLNRRLSLGTPDELGELADTFDQMLARLEAAFDRQRQFTADASHELRTPLTIIDVETERVLARRRAPEEYERALQIIRSENAGMSQLVNDLLTLARMEPGRLALRPAQLDLSDVTLEVVERLAPLARGQGVRLSVGELAELPITGDRQYLILMLNNLVDNAIKYSAGQEPAIRVETGRTGQPGSPTAWVRVADNGPGISAQHLPRVFDRFYRVDPARARAAGRDGPQATPGGNGLGLSIAQQIARAHGGLISVRSSGLPGEGCLFEVTLPLARDVSL